MPEEMQMYHTSSTTLYWLHGFSRNMGLWKGWTILIDALYVSAQNISFALSLLATPSAEAQEYYQWNVLCYKCFFFFLKRGQRIIPLKCLLLVTRQPALGWGKCLCACTSARRLSVMTAERDRLWMTGIFLWIWALLNFMCTLQQCIFNILKTYLLGLCLNLYWPWCLHFVQLGINMGKHILFLGKGSPRICHEGCQKR